MVLKQTDGLKIALNDKPFLLEKSDFEKITLIMETLGLENRNNGNLSGGQETKDITRKNSDTMIVLIQSIL